MQVSGEGGLVEIRINNIRLLARSVLNSLRRFPEEFQYHVQREDPFPELHDYTFVIRVSWPSDRGIDLQALVQLPPQNAGPRQFDRLARWPPSGADNFSTNSGRRSNGPMRWLCMALGGANMSEQGPSMQPPISSCAALSSRALHGGGGAAAG